MEVSIWLFLLYAAFAVIALRSLLTLMNQHKQIHLYILKKQAKKEAERKAALEANQAKEAKQAAQPKKQENRVA